MSLKKIVKIENICGGRHINLGNLARSLASRQKKDDFLSANVGSKEQNRHVKNQKNENRNDSKSAPP